LKSLKRRKIINFFEFFAFIKGFLGPIKGAVQSLLHFRGKITREVPPGKASDEQKGTFLKGLKMGAK
jgi:hypothetical protein